MKHATVYVFGAGATRGGSFVDPAKNSCLPPLDRDFFTQLQRVRSRKHQKLVKQVMIDVVELFGNNFDSTMEMVFTTLEHTIHMLSITGDNRGFKRKDLIEKRDRLVDAIHLVLEESLCARKDGGSGTSREPSVCEYHEQFVKNHLKPNETIISFNYDCMLDYALREFGSQLWNAKYGYSLPLKRGRPSSLTGSEYWTNCGKPVGKNTTVNLYKLHGSLNFKCSQNGDDIQGELKQRPYTRQNGRPQFTIIPPEWNKPYDKGVFSRLWKNAAVALNKATKIILVGYSLPLTDLHANALFRTSIRKEAIETLIVVNPDREARKRIRTVLQRGMKRDTRVISFDSFREYAYSSRDILSWE